MEMSFTKTGTQKVGAVSVCVLVDRKLYCTGWHSVGCMQLTTWTLGLCGACLPSQLESLGRTQALSTFWLTYLMCVLHPSKQEESRRAWARKFGHLKGWCLSPNYQAVGEGDEGTFNSSVRGVLNEESRAWVSNLMTNLCGQTLWQWETLYHWLLATHH